MHVYDPLIITQKSSWYRTLSSMRPVYQVNLRMLTKMLQGGCLHLCRKIYHLQQTFISFFRCSVFPLHDIKRGEKPTETEGLFRVDRKTCVLWFNFYRHKVLRPPHTCNNHTRGRVGLIAYDCFSVLVHVSVCVIAVHAELPL